MGSVDTAFTGIPLLLLLRSLCRKKTLMYKVLIVDDSDVARQLLMSIFALSDDFTVIGVACDGREGFDKACRLKPDLITMDLHMPVMDGYESVERIMSEVPAPIMVITSYKEAETAFRCIALGALEVIDKPGLYDLEDDSFVEDFLDRARLLATTRVIRRIASPGMRDVKGSLHDLESFPEKPYSQNIHVYPGHDIPVPERLSDDRAEHLLAIASSTGGPQALCEILKRLPETFPAAVLIVQHLSAGFEEGFASWLGSHSTLPVAVAGDGDPLLPGQVLIAPPGKHIVVSSSRNVEYFDSPPVASHIPSARFLFESAAEVYGSECTGVILTGMGADGSKEIGLVKSAGGLTIAQDEATSVIFGMPGVASRLGTINEVLPLGRIADRIVKWVCP